MNKLGKLSLISVIILASCTTLKFDPRQVVEDSDFAKKVGSVDAAQTWNLAVEKTVTVSGSGPVRVYVSDGKKSRLVAEQNISGTKTIKFDAVAGAKNVTVMNMRGGEMKTVPVGGSVSFVSTKSTYSGDSVVSAELINEYSPFTYATTEADVSTAAFSDLDSSASLFYSESGTFTLNPAWYTNETSITGWGATLGIYYYDESGNKVDVPIFKNDRANDMVLAGVTSTGTRVATEDFIDIGKIGDFTGIYYTKGIKVNVPAKTAFGFYITVGTDYWGGKFYSESKYNSVAGMSSDTGEFIADELGKYGHVSLIKVDGRSYLALDDWCELAGHSTTNPEYRHLVFGVGGDLSDRMGDDPSGEEDSWILACEDLGESADYDFNDVVISVEHKAGETVAQVKLLAAGGTLSSVLYYEDECLGEVHELFGVKTTDMVNTFPQLKKLPPIPMTISVPADFTMSATDMGGFKVVRGSSSSVIAAPDQGCVPYMICIPGAWKWPTEMTNIADAYPQFPTWCANHTQAQDWYLSPVEGKVYNK